MIYPFVPSPAPIEEIKNSEAYRLHELLEKTPFSKISNTDKEKLKIIFNELWHAEAYKYGVIKLRGYKIDFKKHLKTFWVKTKYYGIIEIRAFSKTFVRKCSVNSSHILKIVEIN